MGGWHGDRAGRPSSRASARWSPGPMDGYLVLTLAIAPFSALPVGPDSPLLVPR